MKELLGNTFCIQSYTHTHTHTHTHLQCRRPGFDPWVEKIPWRRKWQPTLVFSPEKSHGWRSLVGYSPWDCKESDMTDQFERALRKHFLHTVLYTYIHIYMHTNITYIYTYIHTHTYNLCVYIYVYSQFHYMYETIFQWNYFNFQRNCCQNWVKGERGYYFSDLT